MTTKRAASHQDLTKLKWHYPPLFNCMKFAFCPDAAAWEIERALVLKTANVDIDEYPDNAGMCISFHNKSGDLCVLVTLGDELDEDPIELVSTLAHESYHVACHALRSADERDAGEETVAYLVGGLANTIWTDYVATRGKSRYGKK